MGTKDVMVYVYERAFFHRQVHVEVTHPNENQIALHFEEIPEVNLFRVIVIG